MTRTEFTTILDAQYGVHLALAPQDVYKLIYQAVFGPEHSITQWRVAAENLYLEMLHLPDAPALEPLLEPLSPTLCRVNLQPYKVQGHSVRTLWTLFKQTVRTYQPGTLDDLICYWKFFLATPWASHYPLALLEQFWQRMATIDFQPVHHSRTYATTNHPHYRVVLRHLAEQRLHSHRP